MSQTNPLTLVSDSSPQDVVKQSAALFAEQQRLVSCRADCLFVGLLACQWLGAMGIALLDSSASGYGGWCRALFTAVLAGGVLTLIPCVLAFLQSGRVLTRHVIGVAQLLMSGLLIHLTAGRPETYFHVFGSLAFLAIYRDWRVLVTGALAAAIAPYLGHELLPDSGRGAAPPQFGSYIGWILFEDLFLILSCVQSAAAARKIADEQATAETAYASMCSSAALLKESEERFRSLSASAPIAILQTDENGEVVYSNESWKNLVGRVEDNDRQSWLALVHPEDRAVVSRSWFDSVRVAGEWSADFRLMHSSENVRWVHGRATPLRQQDRCDAGYILSFIDITDRKQAEEDRRIAHEELEMRVERRTSELASTHQAVQRQYSILKAQLEASSDGIIVINEEGYIASYNHRFCALWDLTDLQVHGEKCARLLNLLTSLVRDPDLFSEAMSHSFENPSDACTDEVELLDGRILDRCSRPAFSDSGLYYGQVWYFRDVTDRRRSELQIVRLNRDLSRANEALIDAYDASIDGWSRAMDLRDKETEGHSRRVTELTLSMAVAMGISGDDLIQIRRGALLHDIGKMGVPDHILLKTSALNEEEWRLMRRHPIYAYEMLWPIAFLRPALDIPWCHHEKWDGTGYPRGLRGEEIPLAARVFAVVDVWDALRSDRPYRPGWPEERVLDHIRALSGAHFDPAVVDMFCTVVQSGGVLPNIPACRGLELFCESSEIREPVQHGTELRKAA